MDAEYSDQVSLSCLRIGKRYGELSGKLIMQLLKAAGHDLWVGVTTIAGKIPARNKANTASQEAEENVLPNMGGHEHSESESRNGSEQGNPGPESKDGNEPENPTPGNGGELPYGRNVQGYSECTVEVMRVGDMVADPDKMTKIDLSELKDKDQLESMLRKYDIDCSIRLDNSTDPPSYLVFFKTDEAEKMYEALMEYANLDKNGNPKREDVGEPKKSPKEQINEINNAQRKQDDIEKTASKTLKRTERGMSQNHDRGVIPR